MFALYMQTQTIIYILTNKLRANCKHQITNVQLLCFVNYLRLLCDLYFCVYYNLIYYVSDIHANANIISFMLCVKQRIAQHVILYINILIILHLHLVYYKSLEFTTKIICYMQ